MCFSLRCSIFFHVADRVVDPCSLASVAFAVCSSLFSGFLTSLACLLFSFSAGRRFTGLGCGAGSAVSYFLFVGAGCCLSVDERCCLCG